MESIGEAGGMSAAAAAAAGAAGRRESGGGGGGGGGGAGAAAAAGLDAALHQLGVFGLYQQYVVLLLCIPSLLASIYSFNYVFVADRTEHRCVIPECEGTSPAYNNSAIYGLLPEDSCTRYPPGAPTETTDPCTRGYYNMDITIKCEHFVYENDYSIVSDFDLACREWMRTLVGTLHQAALPISLLLTGYTSDTFGRRMGLCVFSACIGVMGIVKSFSVNYYMFVTMEFLESALGYGFNSCAYVMLLEIAHPSVRGAVACLSGVSYGVGGCVFALAAWLLPRWRTLLRVLYLPALLLPLYGLALDESMRWLHSKGRTDKLDRVIRRAARWNKVALDEELMKNIGQRSSPSRSTGSNWKLLLKSRSLIVRFFICGWVWIATAFVYYGLTINSVSLAGDKYVNYALNMLMEIVASLLLMMTLERLGRKWTVFFTTLLCGVACVVPFFIKHTGTTVALYFMGKMSVTMAFNATYVLSAELFPTSVRASTLAALSLLGRLGSTLAPQTPLLSMSVQAMLYGAVTLTSAVSVLLLPETLGAALPHTLPSTRTHSGAQDDSSILHTM